MRTGSPSQQVWQGLEPGAERSRAGQVPESLFSCKGQGQIAFAVDGRRGSGEIASVLARFSTLEGYASRDRRNGVGFSRVERENDRSPSWFSSGVGTKADAKQQQ